MPHQKKPRLDGPAADAAISAVVAHNAAAMANELSGDIVLQIFLDASLPKILCECGV